MLVVVSGPPGSGKTTLAQGSRPPSGVRRSLATRSSRAWPTPPRVSPARPGDELTRRTFPVFFAVLDLLLRSGVTTVAEAAFQDHVWRPRLEELRSLAEIRVVHCTVAADVAFARITRREQDDPLRRVHAAPGDAAGHAMRRTARSAG